MEYYKEKLNAGVFRDSMFAMAQKSTDYTHDAVWQQGTRKAESQRHPRKGER